MLLCIKIPLNSCRFVLFFQDLDRKSQFVVIMTHTNVCINRRKERFENSLQVTRMPGIGVICNPIFLKVCHFVIVFQHMLSGKRRIILANTHMNVPKWKDGEPIRLPL